MINMHTNGREFREYEYKDIITDSGGEAFLLDGYHNFGWEEEHSLIRNEIDYVPYSNTRILHLKRNRKIVNKMELTRLQRRFEACVSEVGELERAKTSIPSTCALIVGVVGIICLAGAVLAVTGQEQHIVLCVILAIHALLGCIFPFFVYRSMLVKQSQKLTPIIKEKYEEIQEICKKGKQLLHLDN